MTTKPLNITELERKALILMVKRCIEREHNSIYICSAIGKEIVEGILTKLEKPNEGASHEAK